MPFVPRTEERTVRSYRFRLRLRPEQEARLRRHASACRWIWNRAIEEQQRRYEAGEKYANYVEMAKWLVAWRHAPETAWLADGASDAQQHTLMRLHQAYEQFFDAVREQRAVFAATGKKKRLRWGIPRLKKRGQEAGLRSPNKLYVAFDPVHGRVKVPKFGWLRVRQSCPVEGKLCNVTITCKSGKWYASLMVELPHVAPSLDLVPTLGIDLGVTNFAALSTGQIIAPLAARKQQEGRLRYAQRVVSRRKLGSRNRRKAVKKLARVHERIAQQRNDWLQKLTTQLANQHPVIAIEDLRVRDMSGSARGTIDAPGKGVSQKAGLNRSIRDAAWGEFRRQLQYKCAAHGGEVFAVPPAYTSRTCRICGHEAAGNRKTQSVFACLSCGHTEHADINAAKNILAAGHAAWARVREQPRTAPDACGGAVSPSRKRRQMPQKQEPTEEANDVA